MSNKINFLEILKEYDENYCTAKEILEHSIKENNTYKEYCMTKNLPLEWYSQIDFRKIKNLCNSTSIFESFYCLDENAIEIFISVLNETNLFLKYYDKYKWNNLRAEKERKALKNNYLKVIEDLETYSDDKTIEELKLRCKALDKKPTITERKIFENFLSCVHILINYKNKLSNKTVNIVNDIIKLYFDKDITFSRKTNIERFTTYTYIIETQQKIHINHS